MKLLHALVASGLLGMALSPMANATSKIVGGEVSKNSYSWMVSMHYSNSNDAYQSQFCGGSLIASRWVLTAAHCVADLTAADLVVGAGHQNLNDLDTDKLTRVTAIHAHESYNPDTFDNDIALLELATPINNIPVTLLASSEVSALEVGDSFLVMGWGNRDGAGGEDYPNELHEVMLPFQTNASCSDIYGTDFDNRVLCTGTVSGGKDSCQGDSGGPLLYPSNGNWQQAGVVSFGEGCAQAGVFGVNTRVATFRSWMKDVSDIDFYATDAPGGGEGNDDSGGGGSIGWLVAALGAWRVFGRSRLLDGGNR